MHRKFARLLQFALDQLFTKLFLYVVDCPYAGSCGNVPSKPVRAKGENTDSAAEFVNCNSKALQAEYQSGKSKWNKRNAISFKAMNDALEEGTRG